VFQICCYFYNGVFGMESIHLQFLKQILLFSTESVLLRSCALRHTSTCFNNLTSNNAALGCSKLKVVTPLVSYSTEVAQSSSDKPAPYSPFQSPSNKAEYALARVDDLVNWARKVGIYNKLNIFMFSYNYFQ